MEQIPVIKTPEQLAQYLADLLKNNPSATSPQGWNQFSIKPFNDGKTVLAIQDGDGQTTSLHSVWLKKGPSGQFDQFVMVKNSQLQAYLAAEGMVPLNEALKDNIRTSNPVPQGQSVEDFLRNKNIKIFEGSRVSVLDLVAKGMVTQPSAQKSWIKDDRAVTLSPPPSQVHTALDKDGKRLVISEEQVPGARGYRELWVKGGTPSTPGTEVRPENNLTDQGYRYGDVYNASGAITGPYTQVMTFLKAGQNAAKIETQALEGGQTQKVAGVVMTSAMKGLGNVSMASPPAPPKIIETVAAPVVAAQPVARIPNVASVEQLAAQNYTASLGGVQRLEADQSDHMAREIGYRDAYRGMNSLYALMGEYMNAQGSEKMAAQNKILEAFGPSANGRYVGIAPGYRQIAVEYIRESLALERPADVGPYTRQIQALYESNSNLIDAKTFLSIKDKEIQALLEAKKPKDDFAASDVKSGLSEPLSDVFARAHGFEPPAAAWTLVADAAPSNDVSATRLQVAGSKPA